MGLAQPLPERKDMGGLRRSLPGIMGSLTPDLELSLNSYNLYNQFSLIYLIHNDFSVFIPIFPAFTCCI